MNPLDIRCRSSVLFFLFLLLNTITTFALPSSSSSGSDGLAIVDLVKRHTVVCLDQCTPDYENCDPQTANCEYIYKNCLSQCERPRKEKNLDKRDAGPRPHTFECVQQCDLSSGSCSDLTGPAYRRCQRSCLLNCERSLIKRDATPEPQSIPVDNLGPGFPKDLCPGRCCDRLRLCKDAPIKCENAFKNCVAGCAVDIPPGTVTDDRRKPTSSICHLSIHPSVPTIPDPNPCCLRGSDPSTSFDCVWCPPEPPVAISAAPASAPAIEKRTVSPSTSSPSSLQDCLDDCKVQYRLDHAAQNRSNCQTICRFESRRGNGMTNKLEMRTVPPPVMAAGLSVGDVPSQNTVVSTAKTQQKA